MIEALGADTLVLVLAGLAAFAIVIVAIRIAIKLAVRLGILAALVLAGLYTVGVVELPF